MIAVAIMGMISVLIASSIQSGIRNKKKTEATLRDESAVYDAMNIISTDINKAFNYQDFHYEIEKRAIEAVNQKINPGTDPNQVNQGAIPLGPQPIKLTQLVGTKDSIHFTSINNFRSRYNSKESKLIEVGYYLDSCKSARTQKNSQCLWRRTAKYLDDDVTKGGDRIVLVENISKFELSYIGPNEQDDWRDNWRTDNRAGAETQNKFPNLIKVSIATTNKADKSVVPISLTNIIEIFFPNNNPLFQKQQNTPQQQQSGGPLGP